MAVAGGTLVAQPSDSDGTGVRISGSLGGKMAFVEMLDRVGEFERQINDDLRHVRHLQEIARKQKDVIKLTCVNDKLIALKAQANVFDTERRDLQSLGADSGERFAVFASVTHAAESAHNLRAEADACVGEPELGGESSNTFTHPPFPDDPTIGDPFKNGIEPPGYASPFN